jgi:hypothetical protein
VGALAGRHRGPVDHRRRRLPDIHTTGEPDLLLSSCINGIKRLPASFTPTG